MTFTSLTFLLFLPIVFAGFWSARRVTTRNVIIVVASYVFYGWWDYRFCALMFISSIIDYFAAIAIEDAGTERRRRALLAISITTNLGILGFFKYFAFFVDSFVAAADSVGVSVSPFTLKSVLPVGISFYTFQTMSYTIDVYRRQIRACRDGWQVLAYVAFFPQLVAGPIERAERLLPQFGRMMRFDRLTAVEGGRLMLWGFFKKMVIADNLSVIVDAAYADPILATGPQLAMATVLFALQIYCDFSAYSDIARGSARWFGIELMRNFDYPYFSHSLTEFWSRWHISLSSWFRDYVYVPLGGNRVSERRRAWNVLATFTLSGLWHGASWTFVIWGLLNGVIVTAERAMRADHRSHRSTGVSRVACGWRIARTFALTCVCWVFFRAQSAGEALLILRKIGSEAISAAAYEPVAAVLTAGLLRTVILGGLLAFVAMEWNSRQREHPFAVHRWPRPIRWAAYTACIWITLSLAASSTGQFIYFQF